MLRYVKNELEREAILVCTDLGVQEKQSKNLLGIRNMGSGETILTPCWSETRIGKYSLS
jgi:hypothetical protein